MISIVIPTHNRSVSVVRLAKALNQQECSERFEAIFVLDHCDDDSYEALNKAGIKFPYSIHQINERSASAARNRGVEQASGDYILFLDDDVIPQLGFLEAHYEAIINENNKRIAFVGPYPLAPDTILKNRLILDIKEWWNDVFNTLKDPEHKSNFMDCLTGNFLINKEIFLITGGFDENLRKDGREDYELGIRLHKSGVRIKYIEKALAYHYPTLDPITLLKKAYSFGRADVYVARKHPDINWPFRSWDHAPFGFKGFKKSIIFKMFKLVGVEKPIYYIGSYFIKNSDKLWDQKFCNLFAELRHIFYYYGATSAMGGDKQLKEFISQKPMISVVMASNTVEPLLSVIIPFFNSKQFLAETIESVFSQTYTNWELLLVDDGSTDGSEQIAMNYVSKFPDKVRYLCHAGKQNRGLPQTRNLGFKNAKGKYIATIDSDDIWLPTKLADHIEIFDIHPEVDVIFGETLYWYSWTQKPEDQKKDFVYAPWVNHGIKPNSIINPPLLLSLLLEYYVMPRPCSIIIRHAELKRIDGWVDIMNNLYEDMAFYVKLFLNATIYINDGYKEKYRKHDDSIVSSYMKDGTIIPSKVFYLKWVKEYLSNQNFYDPQVEEYLNNELKPYRNRFDNNEVEIPLPVGLKNFGELNRTTPISRLHGFDRGKSFYSGQSVARYYINAFLQHYSKDIKGRILEIGCPGYTRQFADGLVFAAKMLNANSNNEQSKLFYNFVSENTGLPKAEYDCVIILQTLMAVYDFQSAIRKTFEALKPGGTLLVTLPGISQIYRPQLELRGDYWRFTDVTVFKVFGEVFGSNNITVTTYGNVLAATAALYGLSVDEIVKEELDFNDPDYQVIIAVRAVKQNKQLVNGFYKEDELNTKLVEIENKVDKLAQKLSLQDNELEEIINSKAWKLALFLRRIRLIVMPRGSNIERFARLLFRIIYSPKKFLLSNYYLAKNIKLIKTSGYFNESWYLENNPDVAQARLDPLKHFLLRGGAEGRDPGPNFSSSSYLKEYEDVCRAGVNPLVHFLRFGKKERRKISTTLESGTAVKKEKNNYGSIICQDVDDQQTLADSTLSKSNNIYIPKIPDYNCNDCSELNYAEIKTAHNKAQSNSRQGEGVRLFAVIGAWMEEDVIEATVKNAFTQGCERVYLVDNGSTDNTVKIACDNGAILAKTFVSEKYNEEERLFYMNSAMKDVSEHEGDQHLWWLFLDADEFPHGPSGMNILNYLRSLDKEFRVVGSRFFDHYPSSNPAYLPGRHPIDFQPLCEEISVPMCSRNHRKHQLLRYDKGLSVIEAGLGFHLVRCPEPVIEPVVTIYCHHFPFREKEITYQKLKKLWAKDKSGAMRANPASDTHMLARLRSIDAVYSQRWESVVNFVSLDPICDSLEEKPAEKGVNLKPWISMVPSQDQFILRWYPMLDY